jgi:hypothetical protein
MFRKPTAPPPPPSPPLVPWSTREPTSEEIEVAEGSLWRTSAENSQVNSLANISTAGEFIKFIEKYFDLVKVLNQNFDDKVIWKPEGSEESKVVYARESVKIPKFEYWATITIPRKGRQHVKSVKLIRYSNEFKLLVTYYTVVIEFNPDNLFHDDEEVAPDDAKLVVKNPRELLHEINKALAPYRKPRTADENKYLANIKLEDIITVEEFLAYMEKKFTTIQGNLNDVVFEKAGETFVIDRKGLHPNDKLIVSKDKDTGKMKLVNEHDPSDWIEIDEEAIKDTIYEDLTPIQIINYQRLKAMTGGRRRRRTKRRHSSRRRRHTRR